RASWPQLLSPGGIEAPSSVQAIVRSRVDRLARGDKELLKLASVIGAEFSLELLEPLAEEKQALKPGLERLEAAAELVPEAAQPSALRYRFKHAIVQEVVYNVLLLKRRRELHGAIARSIETQKGERGLEPHYETLAHHYARSDARERAALYAELAGRKA